MNAPDLFQLLSEYGPEFGVNAPEGQEAVFFNAYFRELREFRGPAIHHAFDLWKAGEFDPKQPALAMIFPQPFQLAHLAKRWVPEDANRLPPLPESMRPRLTPAEVAAQLRAVPVAAMEEPAAFDDEIVL